MATKFFYVRKDGTETMAFPVDGIRSMAPTAADDLQINVEGTGGGTASVKLSVTQGKMDEVIKTIAQAQRADRALLIAIADKVTGKFIHSAITDVEVTTA